MFKKLISKIRKSDKQNTVTVSVKTVETPEIKEQPVVEEKVVEPVEEEKKEYKASKESILKFKAYIKEQEAYQRMLKNHRKTVNFVGDHREMTEREVWVSGKGYEKKMVEITPGLASDMVPGQAYRLHNMYIAYNLLRNRPVDEALYKADNYDSSYVESFMDQFSD